ncbi:MAG TPA: hypothetical protein VM120_29750 [Bryobacteraceae bacterium]|nr:hypothetical protein [Bryobacteraceae bacterium]
MGQREIEHDDVDSAAADPGERGGDAFDALELKHTLAVTGERAAD